MATGRWLDFIANEPNLEWYGIDREKGLVWEVWTDQGEVSVTVVGEEHVTAALRLLFALFDELGLEIIWVDFVRQQSAGLQDDNYEGADSEEVKWEASMESISLEELQPLFVAKSIGGQKLGSVKSSV
jgi:hypothetical protein